MKRPERGLRLGIAAALVGICLTGCVGPFGGGQASSGGSDGGTATGAGAAVAPDANPGKAIVRASFDSPIARNAKVDIGIVNLKVTGRLLQLDLAVTPRVAGEDDVTMFALNGKQNVDVALIDTVNLRRYTVVRDDGGQALGPDQILFSLKNEQPNALTYMFAAPPPDVRAVDVLIGRWPAFRNVPITRG